MIKARRRESKCRSLFSANSFQSKFNVYYQFDSWNDEQYISYTMVTLPPLVLWVFPSHPPWDLGTSHTRLCRGCPWLLPPIPESRQTILVDMDMAEYISGRPERDGCSWLGACTITSDRDRWRLLGPNAPRGTGGTKFVFFLQKS